MQDRTSRYYNSYSATVAQTYEAVDFRPVVTRLLAYVPKGGKLLEMGCGSGRDAAFCLEQGYDVTGLDGSEAMLREAAKYHPELTDRLVHHQLPVSLPFPSGNFDVVTSMAVIMHLQKESLPKVFAEIARVTRKGGIVAYSVNTERSGLDESGDDEKGRHFTCLSAARWSSCTSTRDLKP